MYKRIEKALSWCLVASLTLQPAVLAAQSITVVGPDNGIRPHVDTSYNGTTVINIETPNGAGVSHDIYTDFVADDLIINNSATNSDTQLGGWVEGNENLTPGNEATLWIGEVVGGNQTQLTGIVEVAGQTLDVVLANEFGITCNGCGFINTSRTTLTTGKPQFAGDGSLAGFDVRQGTVTIGAGGLNPENRVALSDTSRVDVIARAAVIYGKMRATDLNVISGSNIVNYDWSYNEATGEISGVTPQAGNGATPGLAIDVSALGGMYANAIKMIATENGVGVRMDGDLVSSTNITLQSNGMLSIGSTGRVKAKKQVRARAKGPILLEGSVTSDDRDDILVNSTASTINLTGEIVGGGIVLESAGLTNIAGAISAQNALKIRSLAGAVTLDSTGEIAGDTVAIAAATDVTLNGAATAMGGLTVDAQNKILAGTNSIINAQDVSLEAAQIDTQGVISADGSVAIIAGVNGGSNSGDITGNDIAVSSQDNYANTGNVAAVNELLLSAASSITSGAGSELFGDVVSIEGADVSLNGMTKADQALSITTTVGALSSAGSLIGTDIALIAATDFTQSGDVTATNDFAVTAGGAINSSNTAHSSGNTVALTGASVDLASDILANSELAISATTGDILNSGVLVGQTTSLNSEDSIHNNGTITALGLLSLDAQETISSSATSALYGQNIALTAKGLETDGVIASEQNIDVTAGIDGIINAADFTADEIAISAAGGLVNSGVFDAQTLTSIEVQGLVSLAETSEIGGIDVRIVGHSIENAGLILSGDTTELIATQTNIVNSGTLGAGNELIVTAVTGFENNGSLQGGVIALTSPTDLIFGANSQISGTEVTFNAPNIVNHGVLSAENTLTLTALIGSITNDGTIVATDIVLHAATDILNEGTIGADSSVSVTANGLITNTADGVLLGGDITLTADGVSLAGLTDSLSAIDIDAGMTGLTVEGDILAQTLVMTSDSDVEISGILDVLGAVTVNAAADVILAQTAVLYGNTISLESETATNAGEVLADTNLTIETRSGDFNNTGVIAGDVTSLTIASDLENTGSIAGLTSLDLMIAGNIVNQAGGLIYADVLTATSASLTSAGTIAGQTSAAIETTTGSLTSSGAIGALDLTLISATDYTNSGTIEAQSLLAQVGSTASFTSTSVIETGTLDLSADQVSLAGGIDASGNVVVSATDGSLANSAEINAQDITFTSSTTLENSGVLDASGVVVLTATESFSNLTDAQIGGLDVTINATSITNQGTALADNQLTANSTTGSINNDGTFGAGQVLNLTSSTTLANTGALLGGQIHLASITDLTFGSTSIIAGTDIDFSAPSISNAGIIASSGDLALTSTSGAVDNSGALSALDVVLTSASSIENSGSIVGEDGAQFTAAQNIVNTADGTISGLSLGIDGASLLNQGAITGNVLLADVTGAAVNQGQITASGLVQIDADSITNSGDLYSFDVTLLADTIVNAAAGDIQGARNVSIGSVTSFSNAGKILAGDQLAIEVTAGILTNSGTLNALDTSLAASGIMVLATGSTLAGQDSVTISAASITDFGADTFAAIATDGAIDITLSNQGLTLLDSDELILVGDLTLDLSGDIVSAGTIRSGGDLTLITAGNLTNDQGVVKSGGDMTLTLEGNLTNISGIIESDGAMVVSAEDIVNRYAELIVTDHTDQGLTPTSTYLPGDNITPGTSISCGGNQCWLRIHQVSTNSWIVGQTVEASGNVPVINANGNLDIEAEEFRNEAGSISSNGDISVTASTFKNEAYQDTAEGFEQLIVSGINDYETGCSSPSGCDSHSDPFSTAGYVQSTGAVATSVSIMGEMDAAGSITINSTTAVNDGEITAGSSEVLGTQVTEGLMSTSGGIVTLNIDADPTTVSTGTAITVGVVTTDGIVANTGTSITTDTFDATSVGGSTVTGVDGIPDVNATGGVTLDGIEGNTGSGTPTVVATDVTGISSSASVTSGVVPTLTDTGNVEDLLAEGTTNIAETNGEFTSYASFLTSNYMMDVDRLQYRDDLINNGFLKPLVQADPKHDYLEKAIDYVKMDVNNVNGISSGLAGYLSPASTGMVLYNDGALSPEAEEVEPRAPPSGDLVINTVNLSGTGGSFTANGGNVNISALGAVSLINTELTGTNVSIVAGLGIVGQGLDVNASEDLSLNATLGGVTLTALSEEYKTYARKGDNQVTKGNTITQTLLNVGGNLAISAGGNITLAAVAGTVGGNTSLLAGGDLDIQAVQEVFSETTSQGRTQTRYGASTSHVTSLTTGGDFIATASGTATLIGAEIDAGGTVQLGAGEGIVLAAAQDIEQSFSRTTRGGMLSKKVTTKTSNRVRNRGVSIRGRGLVSVQTETGDLTTAGTQFESTEGNVSLGSAEGNVLVGTYTDIDQESRTVTRKILGGLLGGTESSSSVDQVATGTEALAGVDLSIASGENTTLIGAQLEAGQDISISTGGNFSVQAAISSQRDEFFSTNNGLVVSTTITENSFVETTELTAFLAGQGISFDITGDAELSIYDYAGISDALPDGVYPEELLTLEGLTFLEEELADEYFYDKQTSLSPAFKALLTIVVTQGMGLSGALNLAGSLETIGGVALTSTTAAGVTTLTWAGSAVNAFATSVAVNSIDGIVSGDFDIGAILEGAIFSGVTAGLTSAIGIEQILGITEDTHASLFEGIFEGFGNGNLSIAAILDGAIDGIITSGLNSAVYGTDFMDGLTTSLISTVVNLTLADVQFEIGSLGDGIPNWEGSANHMILHGLAGCVAAEATGSTCLAGAAGGITSSVLAGYFSNNPVDVDETLPAEQQQAARDAKEQLITRIVSASAGLVVSGGDASAVSTASDVGGSAIANNRQLHIAEEELIEQYADEFAVEQGWCSSKTTCYPEAINRAKAVLTARTLARVDAWHNLNMGMYNNNAADEFLDKLAAENGGWVPGTNQTQQLFVEAPESSAYQNIYLNASMLAQTYDTYALIDGLNHPAASPLNAAFYAMEYERNPSNFEGAEAELTQLKKYLDEMPKSELIKFMTAVQDGIGAGAGSELGWAEAITLAEGNPNYEDALEAVPAPPTGADMMLMAEELVQRKMNGEELTPEEAMLITLAGTAAAIAMATKNKGIFRMLQGLYRKVKAPNNAGGGRFTPDQPVGADGKPIVRTNDRGGILVQPNGSVTCGQHACGMVLNTQGRPVAVDDIIRTHGPDFTTGSSPTQLQQALRDNGVGSTYTPNASVSDLASYTSGGRPAIATVQTGPNTGHAVVVDGVTTRGGQQVVAIRDPAGGTNGGVYYETVSSFEARFTGGVIRMNNQ